MDWILDYESFMPRYSCGPGWAPWMVTLQLTSNIGIALSYLAIANWLWRVRAQLPVGTPQWGLFASFVLACGVTHSLDALMFSHPVYRVDTIMRMVTLAFSVATAALLPAFSAALRQHRRQSSVDQQQLLERWRDRVRLALLRAEQRPQDVGDILRQLERDLDCA